MIIRRSYESAAFSVVGRPHRAFLVSCSPIYFATLALHIGHEALIINHLSAHSEWKTCSTGLHGSTVKC